MSEKPSRVILVKMVREGLLVKRFHAIAHVNMPETVGHHTCNMISLLFVLYDGKPPVELIHMALHHDVPEATLGDPPATAKWLFPKLAEAYQDAENEIVKKIGLADHRLDPVQSAVLRFVDRLDLCLKCVEEVDTGNELFKGIFINGAEECIRLLSGPLKDFPAAHELYFSLFEVQHVETGPVH